MNEDYKKLEEELIGTSKEVPFEDGDGSKTMMVIQSTSGSIGMNMGKENWKLANEMRASGVKKLGLKKHGVLRGDIGVRSHGFTRIAGLALIIAIAGVVMAYLAFRY